jgi:hypothetical protein
MRIPALLVAALLLPLPLAQAAQAAEPAQQAAQVAEPAQQAAQTVQSIPATPISKAWFPGVPGGPAVPALTDEPGEAGQSALPGRLYVLPATVGTAPRKLVGPALRSGVRDHRIGRRDLREPRQPARTTGSPLGRPVSANSR